MAKGNEMVLLLKAENSQLKAKLKESEKTIGKLSKTTVKSTSSMTSAFKKMGTAIVAYMGYRAVRALVDLAAEISSVETAFRGLAAGVAGGSDALVQAISTAARGTISQLDIMKQSNLALQLMGEEVATHLPKMAEIALATARATGRSVSQAYGDLIVATGRQSVLVLDNLGISSAVASAKMDEFARNIGKTRNQLTAAEKRAAFFFAAMEAGQELVNRTNLSILTFGESLQMIKAKSADASAAIAKKFTPAMRAAAIYMNYASTSSSFLVKGFAKILGWANRAVVGILKLIQTLETYYQMNRAENLGDEVGEQIAQYENLNRLIRERANLPAGTGRRATRAAATPEERTQLTLLYHTIQSYSSEVQGVAGDLAAAARASAAIQKLIDDEGNRSPAPPPPPPSIPTGTGTGTGTGTPGSAADMGAYYKYTDQLRLADLEAEKKRYAALMELHKGNQERRTAITEANERRRNEIEREHDVFRKTAFEGWVKGFENAYSSFESATKSALKETLLGKGGWKAWRQSMKEILAQLVVDLGYAIAKALLLRAVTAGVSGGAGGGGLAAVIAGSIFEKGRVPSFQKGRIPMLASGIPSDHFPAFIGAREAVINAESTKANYQMLKAMNANPGKQMQTPSMNQTINVSGNVLTRDFVERDVVRTLQDVARRNGTDLFKRQGV